MTDKNMTDNLEAAVIRAKESACYFVEEFIDAVANGDISYADYDGFLKCLMQDIENAVFHCDALHPSDVARFAWRDESGSNGGE